MVGKVAGEVQVVGRGGESESEKFGQKPTLGGKDGNHRAQSRPYIVSKHGKEIYLEKLWGVGDGESYGEIALLF